MVYARPFGHTSSIRNTTLPAIFAPASLVFEALARQKLPGWQPATSCLDPCAGHSSPLIRTRTAEVYSICLRNASFFLRKNKLFLRLKRIFVCISAYKKRYDPAYAVRLICCPALADQKEIPSGWMDGRPSRTRTHSLRLAQVAALEPHWGSIHSRDQDSSPLPPCRKKEPTHPGGFFFVKDRVKGHQSIERPRKRHRRTSQQARI